MIGLRYSTITKDQRINSVFSFISTDYLLYNGSFSFGTHVLFTVVVVVWVLLFELEELPEV